MSRSIIGSVDPTIAVMGIITAMATAIALINSSHNGTTITHTSAQTGNESSENHQSKAAPVYQQQDRYLSPIENSVAYHNDEKVLHNLTQNSVTQTQSIKDIALQNRQQQVAFDNDAKLFKKPVHMREKPKNHQVVEQAAQFCGPLKSKL